jgi:CMP-N-acetylneuraminic acid synthetase
MPNGAMYWFKKEFAEKETKIITTETHSFLMDRISSIDIDDEFDWKIALTFMMGK